MAYTCKNTKKYFITLAFDYFLLLRSARDRYSQSVASAVKRHYLYITTNKALTF